MSAQLSAVSFPLDESNVYPFHSSFIPVVLILVGSIMPAPLSPDQRLQAPSRHRLCHP
jgi:hypothetical protein